MKKNLTMRVVIAAFVMIAPAFIGATTAQANACDTPGCVTWTSYYDGTGTSVDRVVGLAASPDGASVYVAGYGSEDHGGAVNHDFVVVSYDAATGAQQWVARVDAGSAELPNAMALSPDGATIAVTGHYGYGRFMTVAIDAANGDTLWTHGGSDGARTNGNSHTVAFGGDSKTVYVAGTSAYSTGQFRAVAHDAASGAVLWSKTVWTGQGVVTDSIMHPDGGTLFVSGYSKRASWTPASYNDAVLVAVDTASGDTSWVDQFHRQSGRDEYHALAVAADGSAVYAAGTAQASTAYDYATVAYDPATGTKLWSQFHNGPINNHDEARDIVVAGDSVFVTGTMMDENRRPVAGTVSYAAATGEMQWVDHYNGPPSGWTPDYHGYTLAASPDGQQVYVGARTVWSNWDFVGIAYGAQAGNVLWGAINIEPGADYVSEMAVNPLGTALYMAGFGGTPAAGGQHFQTSAFTLAVPPGTVENLAATAGPGVGQISLAWSPPLDDGGAAISHYRVHRAASADGDFVHLADSSAPAFRDTGLPNGATFHYRVSAVNSAGEGAMGSAVEATTFDFPTAPMNLESSAGPEIRQATLAWDAPAFDGGTPVTAYSVYRDGAHIAELAAGARGFTDNERLPGLSYTYAVAALNMVGEGPDSAACGNTSPWAETEFAACEDLPAEPVPPAPEDVYPCTMPPAPEAPALPADPPALPELPTLPMEIPVVPVEIPGIELPPVDVPGSPEGAPTPPARPDLPSAPDAPEAPCSVIDDPASAVPDDAPEAPETPEAPEAPDTPVRPLELP